MTLKAVTIAKVSGATLVAKLNHINTVSKKCTWLSNSCRFQVWMCSANSTFPNLSRQQALESHLFLCSMACASSLNRARTMSRWRATRYRWPLQCFSMTIELISSSPTSQPWFFIRTVTVSLYSLRMVKRCANLCAMLLTRLQSPLALVPSANLSLRSNSSIHMEVNRFWAEMNSSMPVCAPRSSISTRTPPGQVLITFLSMWQAQMMATSHWGRLTRKT